MSVSVAWDDVQCTIIRVNCSDRWTVSELFQAINEVQNKLHSVTHKVDILVDLTFSIVSPRNLLPVANRIEELYCTNQGELIIVRADPFIKSLGSIARVLAPRAFAPLRFMDTVDNAYSYLQEQSADLFVA